MTKNSTVTCNWKKLLSDPSSCIIFPICKWFVYSSDLVVYFKCNVFVSTTRSEPSYRCLVCRMIVAENSWKILSINSSKDSSWKQELVWRSQTVSCYQSRGWLNWQKQNLKLANLSENIYISSMASLFDEILLIRAWDWIWWEIATEWALTFLSEIQCRWYVYPHMDCIQQVDECPVFLWNRLREH